MSPQGLRVVEAAAGPKQLQRRKRTIAACAGADRLDSIRQGDTLASEGIHAYNLLGITFATDVYAYFYGADVEPINAEKFRRLILHPLLRKHKPHLKIIVGGPGSWQIEKKVPQD